MRKDLSVKNELLSQKTYKFDEVYKKCIAYFDGDSMAAEVFMNKYALKNLKGEFLEDSPDRKSVV
jgi:ribonucleoside-diphosphate reductase alpha chain